MVFESVVVPLDNVIGEIGQGLQTGLKQIGRVRLNLCATACGSAIFAINEAKRTLMQPHRSGSPLGEKEGVQLRFGDMMLQVILSLCSTSTVKHSTFDGIYIYMCTGGSGKIVAVSDCHARR